MHSKSVLLAASFAILVGCGQGGGGTGEKGGSEGSAGAAGSGGNGSGGVAGSGGKGGSGGVAGSGGSDGSGGSGGVAGSGGNGGSGGSGVGGRGGSGGTAGSGGSTGKGGSGGVGSGGTTGGTTGSGGTTGTGGAAGGSSGTGRGGSGGGTAGGGGTTGTSTCPAETSTYLSPVTPASYKIGGPLWKGRVKAVITTWIPYVSNKLSDTALAEGGIANFVEAGKKLKGGSAAKHVGLWFSNAYIMQQVEAMSAALLVDPQGDSQISGAQSTIKSKLADWIPKILSAQESDGYLQTAITLGSTEYGSPARWTNRMFHEGYVAGYFLEAAIMHNLATGETTLLDAARKLADCWVTNIGPSPKKLWWDGHEEMEQALTRFARFVNEKDGAGKGDSYAQLAKFLLDSRGKAGPGTDANDPGQNNAEYDQHQTAPSSQTTAVGHAVRALYLYSGMADVAMTTGTTAYLTAVDKIWDNMVNSKMYVNACVGAGDAQSADEGFGPDYHLPSVSYCESCGGCGVLFFQHKMMLAHKDSRYADLAEMSLYNTVLGSIDLAGANFDYRNPLDQTSLRYNWHPCPCCVGNIPRTVLEMPIWTYAKSDSALYVNLFIDSTMSVGQVAGTKVQVVQTTDYPWSGNVSITMNPDAAKSFALKIRVPDRSVSTLYSGTPEVSGITSVSVNGSAVTPSISAGYATICRTWAAGDKVELVLPLSVQRVKAISQVTDVSGRVALQYGPLLYNIENADSSGADLDTLILDSGAALTATFNGSLLEGVTTITGKFKNGTSMNAIPYYARLNRGPTTSPRSMVWIKDQ